MSSLAFMFAVTEFVFGAASIVLARPTLSTHMSCLHAVLHASHRLDSNPIDFDLLPVVNAPRRAQPDSGLMVEFHMRDIPLRNHALRQRLDRRGASRHEERIGLNLPTRRRTADGIATIAFRSVFLLKAVLLHAV